MNEIGGRAADRFACNRKENRIKRVLNGAIIRGNGEGAKSELRRVVMSASWGVGQGVGTIFLAEPTTRSFLASFRARKVSPTFTTHRGARSLRRNRVTRFQPLNHGHANTKHRQANAVLF